MLLHYTKHIIPFQKDFYFNNLPNQMIHTILINKR